MLKGPAVWPLCFWATLVSEGRMRDGERKEAGAVESGVRNSLPPPPLLPHRGQCCRTRPPRGGSGALPFPDLSLCSSRFRPSKVALGEAGDP